MRRFLVLFQRYILRDLARNPGRTLLTLTGVALGIAVVVGIHLANDRAIGSFNDSLSLLNGNSDLQIAANGLDLDENLIGELSWLWDVGVMTAIVESRVGLVQDEPRADLISREPLHLFGIDLLSDVPFRTYTLREGEQLGLEVSRDDFVDLLVDPGAIVIPEVLAQELGVAVGDSIELLIANRRREFQVGAVLRDTGVARAFDGRVVFMDIAAAQWALGRIGAIDRIEIILDPDADVERVRERVRMQLPDSVVVYQPDDTTAETERMTRAFRYNLTALSYIALAVGMILIYNTLNIAVVRRRAEIGTLRTLGTNRATIRWMFLIEATAFGIVGAVLGVWAGEVLADTAGALVSRTISMIYTGVSVSAASDGTGWGLYLQMILLGGGLAAFSGTGPALRATAVPPVDTFRGTASRKPHRRWTLGGMTAFGLGTILAFAPAIGSFPFLGYAAGISFIVAFGLLSPMFASVLLGPAGRLFTLLSPAEGRLAVQTIRGSLQRIVVAVVSLAIAVAMLISVAIMVASFRETIVVWVDQTLEGDLYIRPAGPGGGGGRNVLETETLEVLVSMPEIAAIDRFHAIGIDYDGFPATLAGGEFRTIAVHGRLLFMGGRETGEVASRMTGTARVIVSEPFAVRHGVAEGATLMLPTPRGLEPFVVEAVFYDYSSEGGLVVMDRGTFVEKLADDAVSNAAIYLRPGADPDLVRARIAEQLPGVELRIATNGELRSQVLRVFDQTFEVTYALEVIALAVAMLGIANTLAALILERRPELAMLRFVGAARAQIRRVILLESGLIGLLGTAIGSALGIVLSLLLVYVINFQSFGWTIQFALPLDFLLQSMAFVLVATLAAGFYPAALALRMDPIKDIRAE